MKKVITFGVFDFFHYGHLKLLERAKALGDYLIVAIQVDEQIKINKPQSEILYNFDQRSEMVLAVKYVDEVVPYTQIDEDIVNIDFDVLVLGGDQTHAGMQRAKCWAEKNGKQVVVLSRTPGVCSTDIKKKL